MSDTPPSPLRRGAHREYLGLVLVLVLLVTLFSTLSEHFLHACSLGQHLFQ